MKNNDTSLVWGIFRNVW